MVHRILLDRHLEVLGRLVEIPTNELNDAQGVHDLRVLTLQPIRLNESLFEVIQLKYITLLEDGQATEVRMVLEPVCQVLHSFLPLELIGARDSEAHQTVEVVGICLVGIPQCDNGEVVLIVLLEQDTQKSPRLSIFLILLDLSFKAKYGLLNFTLVNKDFGLLQEIGVLELVLSVFVVGLEGDGLRCTHLTHSCFFLPDFGPLVHHALTSLTCFLLPMFH